MNAAPDLTLLVPIAFLAAVTYHSSSFIHLEDAAKAVEAIALAERNALLDAKDSPEIFLHKPGGKLFPLRNLTPLPTKLNKLKNCDMTGDFFEENVFQVTEDGYLFRAKIQQEGSKPKKLAVVYDIEFHKSLFDVIPSNDFGWDNPMKGYGMRALPQKLKQLKTALKLWNKEMFGNVYVNILGAQGNVE
ncbi:hypothetical protein ACH5RR_039419 [Cinchona calisaya]|uniref:rRNA N-glycosidase n=1 Tax=Cinchona calisaya TaxID=153742 RepID=A0ABD2XZY8_9GENT